jgi:hypothetical protein
MTVDLSKINYEQFSFILNSDDVEMENVYTDESDGTEANDSNEKLDDSDITLDEESNALVIDVNKKQLNLSKIVLYYQIPENVKVGTKILLNAQVLVQTSETDNNENQENSEEKNTQDANSKVVDEKQIEITVVKSSENKDDKNSEGSKNEESNKNENSANEGNKSEDEKNFGNNNFEENINKDGQANQLSGEEFKNQSSMNMQGDASLNQTVGSISSMQSMETSSSNEKTLAEQMEVATYNGSNNNYLSSLEIDGINLTSDFNKEKLTYFATVEGLETITVNATAEDSSSNVAITGTSLKSGENKVLISVTAENGDVRYYRIYVTNN